MTLAALMMIAPSAAASTMAGDVTQHAPARPGMRIAFIKHGGLSTGGTQRWLQTMAATLPRDRFDVTYFHTVDGADDGRRAYLTKAGVKLVGVSLAGRDHSKRTRDWVDTDLWHLFDPSQFDLVQSGIAGHAEFPFYKLSMPVVHRVALDAGVDYTPNVAHTIHNSEWQRRRWLDKGGVGPSSVIPTPAAPPTTSRNLRNELNIPEDALVAGFHQRVSDDIFSPLPLAAFASIVRANRHFVIMGGSQLYREQASKLGLINVHFVSHTGDNEKISAFLNTLDIFAHGRRDGETFGTVFAEAALAGKPCLSHTSPIANGQVETIGRGGFVALDQNGYARLLDMFFSNGPLRERLGSEAEAAGTEKYSAAAGADRLARIYDSVAEASRSKFRSASSNAVQRLIGDAALRSPGLRSLVKRAAPTPLVRVARRAIRY